MQNNLIQIISAWVSVFVGILGLLMLISSIFLYALAAGEEPKMKKANTVFWGGVFGLAIAVLVYFLGGWLGRITNTI